MSDTAHPCPLCGSASEYGCASGDRNRETTAQRFTYNRCSACRTLFMIDVPDELAPYYVGDYHRFCDDGEPEWRYNPTLIEVEAVRVKMLRRHVESGALVDIGAGPGGFSAAAKQAGFDVTAIEMNERCCEYMREGIGVRAICTEQPIEQLEQLGPVSTIALWHVLEHLRDPARMLTVAAERLQPGGVLALGVPNPDSLQSRVLRTRWVHLDAPRHLCLMPEQAIVSFAASVGLRPLESLTADPFGRQCSLHGWAYALRRRPADGDSPMAVIRTAQAITKLLAPIEESGHRGPALTLLLGKDG